MYCSQLLPTKERVAARANRMPIVDRRGFIVGSSLAGLVACGSKHLSERLEMSIVAVSQELDPYVAANLESAELSWLYADGLAGADVSKPEAGSLCARPPVRSTAGGRPSFDYVLRDGVKWHDGKPVTAQDVADCFHRLRGSTWGHQRPFSLVHRIDVTGPLRFTVVCNSDDPQFPRAFFTPAGSPGVPLVRAGRIPIGTGPMRLTARMPDAWGAERWSGSPRGTPAMARMRLSYLADGRTQEVMLSSGESDVALFVAGPFLAAHDIPYFRRRSGVAYAIVNATGSLADPAMREAFSAAIDRSEIVTKIYHGMNEPYDSVVAPFIEGARIRLAREYDPAFARDAFRKRSPDHVEIAVTEGSSEQIGLLMQEHLARAGVKAFVRKYAVQVYLGPEGPLRSGRFDVAIFGEYFSPDPDLAATWGCAARPPNGGNFSRLCDPALDTFARSGDVRGALEELRRQAVVVPLVGSVQYVGLSKRMRGAGNAHDLIPTVFACAEWSFA
jgi:peptide/nickel transport system substrate-binding protein